ncbi:MAG: thiamine pyrophosphate-binding protein [Candidatus Bathyarchaeota archaeon]|nr:thiamine pyrophosphate-binding protein [Candidatus Bathyarchaeota archaeon]
MTRMTGAKAIAETMKAYGIEHFFHVSGGMISLFIETENAGIDLVLARSEKAAAYMADGYSRVSYKPSVCYGQAGPGAINLAAGISEAYWTCTPVIALTGSTSISDLYKFQYQELDEMPFFEPTTKWNAHIYQAERAGEITRDALNIALSGCPGPVHINLHYDAANNEADIKETTHPSHTTYPSGRTRPDHEDVKKTAEILANSERPVIVAGGGVIISRAWNEVIQLAETLFIPVATTLSGKGTIPDEHPLSIGVVGRYSSSMTNKIVEDADVVFYIGSKAGGMATDNWTVPGQNATILQLDVEPETIGRNYHVASRMVCDAKKGVQDLITVLKEMMLKPEKRSYLQQVETLKKEWTDQASAVMSSEAVPIKPHRVIKEIRQVLGDQDILVADTGQMGAWTGVLYPTIAPGRTYIRAAGTLGWSLPAAIGAKFAVGNNKVLDVTGDGGVAYHISELETALRCDKPFVAVVFNNITLGMLHYGFKWRGEGKALKSSDFTDVDYGKVAEAFNCYGQRIERPGELKEAMENAFDSGKPAIIDVMIDRYELAPISSYRKLPQGRPL